MITYVEELKPLIYVHSFIMLIYREFCGITIAVILKCDSVAPLTTSFHNLFYKVDQIATGSFYKAMKLQEIQDFIFTKF